MILCFSVWKWGIAPFEKQLDMKSQVLHQQIWRPQKMVPCLSWCSSISFVSVNWGRGGGIYTTQKIEVRRKKEGTRSWGFNQWGNWWDSIDESHRIELVKRDLRGFIFVETDGPLLMMSSDMTNHHHPGGSNMACSTILIWLVVWNMAFIFPVSWECHHPNWLIFFRGVETTNQNHGGMSSSRKN